MSTRQTPSRTPCPTVEIASLRCADCGSDAVMAISPGTEADHPGDLFLIARGEDARGWCWPCCERRGWLMETAA